MSNPAWFLIGFASGWTALGLFLAYIEHFHHSLSGRTMEDPPHRGDSFQHPEPGEPDG